MNLLCLGQILEKSESKVGSDQKVGTGYQIVRNLWDISEIDINGIIT